MQFPIIKKEDKSLALEVPDDLLQQLTSKLSTQAEAQLKENEGNLALLQESQAKVAELEEKLAKAEGKTMADYSPEQKADFVINWAKGLSVEDKAIFAEAVGIPIVKATDAEVAEAEQKAKAETDEEPKTIQGRTDKPGYKFLENLNLSVRE